MELVGGKGNVTAATNCMTRLRVKKELPKKVRRLFRKFLFILVLWPFTTGLSAAMHTTFFVHYCRFGKEAQTNTTDL
jgi:hypothetical protein